MKDDIILGYFYAIFHFVVLNEILFQKRHRCNELQKVVFPSIKDLNKHFLFIIYMVTYFLIFLNNFFVLLNKII